MIYEPQHLKSRQVMYEKKDKWLTRLVFLSWLGLSFFYVNIMVSYIRVRLGILATVFGFIVITIVYFLSVFFILMWRRYQFEKLINSIVIEYQETKNGKLLKKITYNRCNV